MITYAGIGSRTLKDGEKDRIENLASTLANLGFIVYSGNADGSDIAFQTGSNGKCVLFLPWKGFNRQSYDISKSLAHFDVGKSEIGIKSIEKFHPNAAALSDGAKLMMARNYHQIHGYNEWPIVNFVICCADQIGNQIKGGTGQACRIASNLGIPIINLRLDSWKDKLKEVLKNCIKSR